MKNALLILIGLLAASNSFGQTKTSENEKLKEEIIASEKAGWDAWKNKNAEWFETNTTPGFLSIGSVEISTKEQVIRGISDCEVKSVSLDDFTFIQIDKNVVFLTYIATQDGICGSNKITSQVRASVNYVKRGGKWLEAVYIETPMEE